MTKDPICGMELVLGWEHSRLEYKGKEYLFCSEACDEIFKKINGLKTGAETLSVAENEKKMIAYNTLKQLAITIAHYIRNANAAISAQAQLHDLQIIKDESAKIETVVKALLSISEVKLQKYVESEEDAILDLRNTLEDKLSGGE